MDQYYESNPKSWGTNIHKLFVYILERTLCMRYLQPGFLSALNYSKSLTELPRMAFLSSVLTTSYIEQIKRKEDSQQEFLRYSNKIRNFLSEISSIMQLALMIFAPFIVVILFKRGAFDDKLFCSLSPYFKY